MKCATLLFLATTLAVGQAPCSVNPDTESGCASNPQSLPTTTGSVPGTYFVTAGSGSAISVPPCGWEGNVVDGQCELDIALPKSYEGLTCKVQYAKDKDHDTIIVCTWKLKEKK